jgi:hypothetical protein
MTQCGDSREDEKGDWSLLARMMLYLAVASMLQAAACGKERLYILYIYMDSRM